MCPPKPIDDSGYCWLVNAEQLGDLLVTDAENMKNSNSLDIILSEFCHPVALPSCVFLESPSLSNHIHHVVVISPRKEMNRTKAVPYIAVVAGIDAAWKRPIGQLESDTVDPLCRTPRAPHSYLSIPPSKSAVPKQTWIFAPMLRRIIGEGGHLRLEVFEIIKMSLRHARALLRRNVLASTLLAQRGAFSIVGAN
jgi:hypothetical protein